MHIPTKHLTAMRRVVLAWSIVITAITCQFVSDSVFNLFALLVAMAFYRILVDRPHFGTEKLVIGIMTAGFVVLYFLRLFPSMNVILLLIIPILAFEAIRDIQWARHHDKDSKIEAESDVSRSEP